MGSNIIVIGFGNTLRGDDGIARLVLRELEKRLDKSIDQTTGSSRIRLVLKHQIDIIDAEVVSESDVVIFVDAHVSERLNDIDIREITGRETTTVNVTHISSPEELIVAAKEIYGTTPRAFVCAVRGYDFEFGEQITEPAQRLAHSAAEQLFCLIETLR